MTRPQFDSLFRSQWHQDRFIFEHLMSFQSGVFFEVGAHNGEELSNTYYFEKALGWTGILVDMQPTMLEEIQARRPNSQVFSCGLAAESARLMWLDVGVGAGLLRYYDPAQIERFENHYKDTEPKPIFNIRWVDVRPIMDVFSEASISHIDYFSLDVEGGEMAILKSIDFSTVTIDLFTIEDNRWSWLEHRALLEPLGYKFIGSLSADGFFLHDRFIDRFLAERGREPLDKAIAKLTRPRS